MSVAKVCKAYYTTEIDKILFGKEYVNTTTNKLYVDGELYEMECVMGENMSEHMRDSIAKFKAIKRTDFLSVPIFI